MSNDNAKFIQIVPTNGKQFVILEGVLKEVILWALADDGEVHALTTDDVYNRCIYDSYGDDYK